MLEKAYGILTRSNSVNIAFVLTGAIVGERIVNGGFDRIWESKNRGKLYHHLEGTVIGGPKEDDE